MNVTDTTPPPDVGLTHAHLGAALSKVFRGAGNVIVDVDRSTPAPVGSTVWLYEHYVAGEGVFPQEVLTFPSPAAAVGWLDSRRLQLIATQTAEHAELVGEGLADEYDLAATVGELHVVVPTGYVAWFAFDAGGEEHILRPEAVTSGRGGELSPATRALDQITYLDGVQAGVEAAADHCGAIRPAARTEILGLLDVIMDEARRFLAEEGA
jgi:hypothetical protein